MYSNGILTWTPGETVSPGDSRGWKGHTWRANNVTSDEPSLDSTMWLLISDFKLTGFTLIEITDPKDFLITKVTGITLIEQHINRPPEVYCSGITMLQYIPKPYILKKTINYFND